MHGAFCTNSAYLPTLGRDLSTCDELPTVYIYSPGTHRYTQDLNISRLPFTLVLTLSLHPLHLRTPDIYHL